MYYSDDSNDSIGWEILEDLDDACVRIFCNIWYSADVPEYLIRLSSKLQQKTLHANQDRWINTNLPGWIINQLVEWMEAFYHQAMSSGKPFDDPDIVEGSLNF